MVNFEDYSIILDHLNAIEPFVEHINVYGNRQMNLDLFDELEIYFKQNGIDCFKDENKVNEFLKYILGEGGKFALKAAK